MTEPTGLMLSNAAAAAKLAAALWLAQIAIVILRRGATVPSWQIALSILTVAASTIAWRAEASTGWLVACLLALLMLIDGLRRWMSQPGQASKTPAGLPLVAVTMALSGFGVCTYAIAVSDSAAKLGGQPHFLMILSLVVLFVLFALLLASTLELTIGSLGAELLSLPWQRFSNIATFAFLAEILLAGWIMMKLKPDESIEVTAAPVIYEFSRLLLSYIAWCMPRRMVLLAQTKVLKGQSSLALAGWIGVLCFVVAMALPTAWPWNTLKL